MTEASKPDFHKISTIEDIVRKDRSVFQNWIPQDTLPFIPQPVLRYLIPTDLFSSARDPNQIDLVIVPSRYKTKTSQFFVVEHTETTLTDMEVLKEYRDKYNNSRSFRASAISTEIDPMHWLYRSNLYDNTFTVKDRVLLTADFAKVAPEHLHVHVYDQRDDLRGKGIATDFYRRLNDMARNMDCKYITGINRARNIGFFTNVLGRSLLVDMSPDVQRILIKNLPRINDYRFVTVTSL
ncbi:MAG TPA: hypothetical protein VNW29_00445 [Candidatus Sulfotelmatobacter sp.]|jgi:hypothetical protein|nr:hypothetical protein [Candidatus Sulfotelmatobacter sp.]